jgi:hypothetical protein
MQQIRNAVRMELAAANTKVGKKGSSASKEAAELFGHGSKV